MKPKNDTSWQKVGNWYDSLVGDEGSYYHKQIIIPNLLRLLELKADSSLIDLACGQGVLASYIPESVEYVGFDAAKSLIQKAKQRHREHQFIVTDITKPLPLPKDACFSHAAIILALQNIQEPLHVLQNLRPRLAPSATLVIVLNHPCFRIPRQSSWGFDEQSKTQYRRINSYMTNQKIPISAHPGKQASLTTWSFHHPLQDYFQFLEKAGFVVQALEEWCSDKESTGKAARWENRARKEFPLFMAIKAIIKA